MSCRSLRTTFRLLRCCSRLRLRHAVLSGVIIPFSRAARAERFFARRKSKNLPASVGGSAYLGKGYPRGKLLREVERRASFRHAAFHGRLREVDRRRNRCRLRRSRFFSNGLLQGVPPAALRERHFSGQKKS